MPLTLIPEPVIRWDPPARPLHNLGLTPSGFYAIALSLGFCRAATWIYFQGVDFVIREATSMRPAPLFLE